MRTVTLSVIVVLMVGMAGALIGRGLSASEQQPQEPAVLSALLTEVRGLRAAMEQMASAAPRVQLALGRLQLQEQRVNTLLRRLETTRETLRRAQDELAETQTHLPGLEASVRDRTAPNLPQATAELEMIKVHLGRQSGEVQRLLAEEASLVADVSAEQGRWTQINQRLEEMERALERR
jgi:hypothetical protein